MDPPQRTCVSRSETSEKADPSSGVPVTSAKATSVAPRSPSPAPVKVGEATDVSIQRSVEEKASPEGAPGASGAARTTEAHAANPTTVVTVSAEKAPSVPEFVGEPAGDLGGGSHESSSASSTSTAAEGDSGRCGGRGKILRQVVSDRTEVRARKHGVLKECPSLSLLTTAMPPEVAAARRGTSARFSMHDPNGTGSLPTTTTASKHRH